MSPAETPVCLSVAVIVRDAAEALRETVVSVKEVADEVVVVDTGSTDDSRKVAQQLGARVFDHTWRDDFSAARNECLSFVRGAWVLWLDAGETLDDLRSFDLILLLIGEKQQYTE